MVRTLLARESVCLTQHISDVNLAQSREVGGNNGVQNLHGQFVKHEVQQGVKRWKNNSRVAQWTDVKVCQCVFAT